MYKHTSYILSLLIAAFLLLEGCGGSGNSFKIKGEFEGMKGGELYLYNPLTPDDKVDTLTIIEGSFNYEGSADEPTVLVLLFPNAMEQVIFAAPGKTIKYRAASNDLKNYVVEGCDENTLMAKFREEVGAASISQQKSIAARYIEENAESVVALYLLDRYFIQSAAPNIKETKKLVKLLMKAHPDNQYLIQTETKLKVTRTQLTVGATLPDLSLNTTSLKPAKLWAKGKDVNFIFFWATWQRNSYDMIWRIRSLQTANKEKPNMRFVGISLDSEIHRWQDNIRMDSLSIEHYCDGLSFASPEIQKLDIANVPTYIIADKNHKIIAVSKDLDEISKKLKEF